MKIPNLKKLLLVLAAGAFVAGCQNRDNMSSDNMNHGSNSMYNNQNPPPLKGQDSQTNGVNPSGTNPN